MNFNVAVQSCVNYATVYVIIAFLYDRSEMNRKEQATTMLLRGAGHTKKQLTF